MAQVFEKPTTPAGLKKVKDKDGDTYTVVSDGRLLDQYGDRLEWTYVLNYYGPLTEIELTPAEEAAEFFGKYDVDIMRIYREAGVPQVNRHLGVLVEHAKASV